MKPTLPLEELMSPGHLACQGCGAGIAMRVSSEGPGPRYDLHLPRLLLDGDRRPVPLFLPGSPPAAHGFRSHGGHRLGHQGGHGRAGQGQDHHLRLGRRRRHVRHRPAGPLRRRRAQRRYFLLLLRQRSLHEHRHPAQRRHALRRLDHHHPGQAFQEGIQEEHRRYRGRPQGALPGHGFGRLSRRSLQKADQGQGYPRLQVHPHHRALPSGLEGPAPRTRSSWPGWPCRPASSPSSKWRAANTSRR